MSASQVAAAAVRGTHLGIVGSYISPYVRKVLAAVYFKQLTYEIDPIVPFYGNDDFRRISPLNRIPILFHGSDVVLVDSTVICEYLDESFPDRGVAMYPTSVSAGGDAYIRAQARLVEEMGDTRFADVLIWQLWYELAIAKNVWGKVPDATIVDRTLTKDIPQLLSFMTTQWIDTFPWSTAKDGGYLFGESPLIADVAVCVSFRNMRYLKYDLTEMYGKEYPHACAYIERVLAHPALAKTAPYEAASLRGKPDERRKNCIDAGAPISEKYNFGTLTVPRGWDE